mmetsp:Transcript_13423/g.29150  ORF Transcript_13423/g.29150 Transcript_13423/m.29150 type:complete len:579 (+) Transcript_13423:275-2011(+)|eukprot:CAMPEP_0172326632 /NCGR_PEP_ID=MMETSP1058-20130122/57129_1 /TAXON_ID=83371 /ORGANISM="Detonula confervacea, Strain CCMP 353" /LENGTH=578 /DNA_ID=CAMNT_0013043463 /DNA_START=198 /DNA_END=1934 /DNA_ORIENTATION=+
MLRIKNVATVTITAAVLSACYTTSTCNLCADALQASPSFPQTPRHNIAHRYLDEGHPYTFDPNNFDMGSSGDLSKEVQMDVPNGMTRTVQATIEMNASRDYIYNYDASPPISVSISEPGRVDDSPVVPREEMVEVPEQQRRTTLRRKSRIAPRSLGSSILPARRKPRTQNSVASSQLLTFDEEKEIAEDIRKFRSVTRARDNLAEWMAREMKRVGGNQHGEPSEYQWASACSLSVDQLHDVMTRGQEARTKLIRGNVGLVTMVAKRYHNILSNGGIGRSTGGGAGGTDATLKLDDLIQEGYMGIMEAAERFDPTKGFRFSTYATHWIRQRILRSIAESSRMIRLPVHVQTMMRNMHKKLKELEEHIGRPPSMPELAHEMGVPLDKIQLYQHLSKNVLSLELPVDRHSNKKDGRTLGDRVACTEIATPDEDFMSEALRGEVHALLDALGQDQRLVLTHRFGLDDGRPKSLREVAEGMGVSIDIVRSVEAKALNKLRQPRMNYRLKDYVGGPGAFGKEPDYVDQHHGGMYNSMANAEEQHQHHTHNPHHMNTARLATNDSVGDGDLGAYERRSPESIWSV